MGKDFEIEEGKEVVRNTIVGGRPLARRKRKIRIPIGIERVLCKAAVDPVFRVALFDNREGALARLGEDLTAEETAILMSIPGENLATMVARIDPAKHTKRRFMKGVMAATLAAMTAGAGGLACDDSSGAKDVTPAIDYGWAGGAGPDWPPDVKTDEGGPVVDVPEGFADAGSWPSSEVQADVLESEDTFASNGIVPDPDVIDVQDNYATKGILPDPDVIEDDIPPVGGIMPDAE